jgi:hypothetical protein
VTNPIANVIGFGDITIKLEEYAQLPAGEQQFARNSMVSLYHSNDGTGRMYAAEPDGGAIIIIEADGSVGATPILDLKDVYGADLIDDQSPTGLHSSAFHPDFHKPGADGEGKFYTVAAMSVTSAQPGVEIQDGPFTPIWHSTLTEWTADPNYHQNTEQLMLNPNAEEGDADCGMLYIAAGDGIVNVPGDPFTEVQDLDNPRGKSCASIRWSS